MASFPGHKSRTVLNFNEARDDGVAVASVRQYANNLHLIPGIVVKYLKYKYLKYVFKIHCMYFVFCILVANKMYFVFCISNT